MVTKRKQRASRSRTCSENMSDDGKPPPKKKVRQRRNTKEDGTIWIDDDTLQEEAGVLTFKVDEDEDEEDDEDSDYDPSDEDESEYIHSEEEENTEDLVKQDTLDLVNNVIDSIKWLPSK